MNGRGKTAAGERGTVLLNALVMVAALSMAAVLLMQTAETSRARLAVGQVAVQVELYLDGLETQVLTVLNRDQRAGDTDHLGETWATTDYAVPVDRGKGAARIRDLQGLFNVNWLSDPAAAIAQAGFDRLLANQGVPLRLGVEIRDFLAPDGPSRAAAYANRSVPLAAPGGPITVLRELLRVPGLTPEHLARLAPVLSVLPPGSRLNLNTAPAPVLQSLMPGLTGDAASALLVSREAAPFTSVEDFQARAAADLGAAALQGADWPRFTVVSRWFAADLVADLDAVRLQRSVLIHRPRQSAGQAGQARIFLRLTETPDNGQQGQ